MVKDQRASRAKGRWRQPRKGLTPRRPSSISLRHLIEKEEGGWVEKEKTISVERIVDSVRRIEGRRVETCHRQ